MMKPFAAALATLVVATIAHAQAPTIRPASAPAISSWRNQGVEHHNRMLLAKALAQGKTDILVLFATEIGATERVARAAAALGAQVQARFDDVGYFRVRAPIARFDELR